MKNRIDRNMIENMHFYSFLLTLIVHHKFLYRKLFNYLDRKAGVFVILHTIRSGP